MKNRILPIAILFSAAGITAAGVFYINSPVHLRQPFLLVLYTLIHFWLLWRHRALRFRTSQVLISIVLGFAWLYSSHAHALSTFTPLRWGLFLVAGLGISFTMFLILQELQRPLLRSTSLSRQSTSAWWMVLYGIIPIIGWLPYFLAYYPAKMNADSFWQWAQAHRITPYNAWHPVVDTWMIQGLADIYNSPASYIIFQMLVMSLVIAYALKTLRSFGMPFWLVILLDLLYALNPANGFLAITMWKDILFAAAILLLTVFFGHMTLTRSWLNRKRNIALVITVCFFAMTLRHNGPEAVAATLLVAMVVFQGRRRRILLLSIPVILLFGLLKGPIEGSLHVTPEPLNEALAIPSQQIAATYKYHGKFTPQLRAYFDRILPAADWSKDYNPYSVNPIKWDKQYKAAVIYQNFPEYLDEWGKLLTLNPSIFVRAYSKQVAVIWKFWSPKSLDPYLDSPATLQHYSLATKIRAPKSVANAPTMTMIKGSYAWYAETLQSQFPGRTVPTYNTFQQRVSQTLTPLQTTSRFVGLRKLLNHVFNATRYNYRNYFVKDAIPLFLLLVSVVASVYRRKGQGLVVYLPAIFVIITIAMAMPATDFRYSFGFVFSVPFLFFFPKLQAEGSA